eukprot:2457011-Pyramimonas_sp.AAC.1
MHCTPICICPIRGIPFERVDEVHLCTQAKVDQSNSRLISLTGWASLPMYAGSPAFVSILALAPMRGRSQWYFPSSSTVPSHHACRSAAGPPRCGACKTAM